MTTHTDPTTNTTDWDAYARLYDAEFEATNDHQQRDTDFWTALANSCGGPILEPAAGSGRITLPLADAGHTVVAVDISPAMLDLLEARRRPDQDIHVLQAGMVDLAGAGRHAPYGVCIIGYGSFQLLTSPDEQRRCLRRIRELLAPDGCLGIDTAPSLCGPAQPDFRSYRFAAAIGGREVAVSAVSRRQVDRAAGTVHFANDYRWEGEGHWHNDTTMRCLPPEALRRLLAECGFMVQAMHGGFAGEALTDDSETCIVVAQPAPPATPAG